MMNRILVTLALLFAMAAVVYGIKLYSEPIEQVKATDCHDKETWTPTEDDIAYQDSMYSIIQHTKEDVDTIKIHIEQIIIRLDEREMH